MNKKILIVDFHGLWFKGGMDSFIRPQIARIPGVVFMTIEATSWSEEEWARNEVEHGPSYSGLVAYGHSLGSKAASTLTDDGKVDLLFLIDTAGALPSRLGNNTGKAYDFQDTAFAMVPKYRPQLVVGQAASKLKRMQFGLGHIGITYSQPMVDIMVSEIRELVRQKGAA